MKIDGKVSFRLWISLIFFFFSDCFFHCMRRLPGIFQSVFGALPLHCLRHLAAFCP